jgi:hypothetical protein
MADILHHIKAKLFPNELTEDPDDYLAKVSAERSIDIAGVCRSATGRGGEPGKPETMEQQARAFLKEMAYLACDGFSVNAEYFTLDTQIKGVFNRADEKFTPGKHSVYFRFNQGDLMRQLIPTITVDVVGVGDAQPVIKSVADVKSGTLNDRLTPGKILKIRGDKIKLVGEHPGIGIWFEAETTGERIRVEADEIGTNNPSELMITIPDLPAGAYCIEVVTQFNGGATLLKEPRTARLNRTLTVD